MKGDFEIHLTGNERGADRLAAFAEAHRLKFSHIVLDRGVRMSQPMLTLSGSGTLEELVGEADRWVAEVREAGMDVVRVKIEAAPWNDGVPRTDQDAVGEPDVRHFEHHVKVLLPDASIERLVALTEAVTPHGARPSRNARRKRTDGREERFVTQRCHEVGRVTARQRLDALLEALRANGFEVLETEEEYVVHDSRPGVDHGWMRPVRSGGARGYEDAKRTAPAGLPWYPTTYRPVTGDGVTQRAAFDPSLRQFQHAYRAGEPLFADAEAGERWRAARRAAMAHVLGLVAGSPWAANLVVRGSVVLRAWLGDAAREPGDLDFVVTPPTMSATGEEAESLLHGVIAAVADSPGPGLRADQVAVEDIWTYERVPGRRLVFPFDVPDLPRGTVQLDFVFNEELPLPPVTVEVDGTSVLAASPELSLAWKLMWLETDTLPQGKDLYDAVLLAEHVKVTLDLTRRLLRANLEWEGTEFTPESVLAWQVDWQNFLDEYPGVHGDLAPWLHRLALALVDQPR